MSIKTVKESLSQKYEFIKLIGKGGFAEVYLAKDKLLEREVAIKILLSQHAGDTEVVERFIREAQLYAKFDQKNLIPIYETGIVKDNAFLVMKYVNGASLKDIIEKEGTINSDLLLKVVKGMASALKYIHNKGIIHRDIKPANILIESETKRIYLADFGIARPISSKTLTQTGMLIGTPYYISPEQIKNGTADKRSDIYALGTTLYELISGSPIFKCETPIEVLYKHVNEPPKPIASINPNITMEMKHIVEKCLEKDPENRFQNANEILDVIATNETKKIENTLNKDNLKKKGPLKLIILILFFVGLTFSVYFYYPSIIKVLNINGEKKTNDEKISDNKDSKLESDSQIDKLANNKLSDNKPIIDSNKKTEEIIPDNKIKSDIKENDNKPIEKNSDSKKNIDKLNKTEITQKKDVIKPKEVSFDDKKYKEYFTLSKSFYDKRKYELADSYLKKAIKHKETVEWYKLNEKVKKELSKIKKKKVVKKKVVKRVSLFKLKPEINKAYLSKVNNIRIIVEKNKTFFINKVKINGQLTVKLQINEFGKLTVQEINKDNLFINPQQSKKRLLRGIWMKLKSIIFLPPLDKNGKKVILENWRVTFRVSKYKNKIILRKV